MDYKPPEVLQAQSPGAAGDWTGPGRAAGQVLTRNGLGTFFARSFMLESINIKSPNYVINNIEI